MPGAPTASAQKGVMSQSGSLGSVALSPAGHSHPVPRGSAQVGLGTGAAEGVLQGSQAQASRLGGGAPRLLLPACLPACGGGAHFWPGGSWSSSLSEPQASPSCCLPSCPRPSVSALAGAPPFLPFLSPTISRSPPEPTVAARNGASPLAVHRHLCHGAPWPGPGLSLWVARPWNMGPGWPPKHGRAKDLWVHSCKGASAAKASSRLPLPAHTPQGS